MSDPFHRRPMSPAEFDVACRRLEQLYPLLSQTSGKRSEAHNARVGGHPESKHLIAMARDYAYEEEVRYSPEPDKQRSNMVLAAVTLGLWTAPSPDCLHVQGLPVGPIPRWWRERYLGEKE